MEESLSRRDALFSKAIEIDSEEQRSAYLASACGSQTELRREVEQLVAAHFRAGNFLEDGSAVTATQAEISDKVIGPYRLREMIGEGGFGVVYIAEQMQPVRRRVALKVLKPGMGSRQVIARFEAERQALALMEHPNIARILDAGTTEEGLPYFVMELVKGVPITHYADEHRLTIRERLSLFVEVCQAVQHAHQKGIIHRDLKPSNILVTVHEDVPVVKVIDFGVAKAMGTQLTEKTIFTGLAQFVGTPEYMSPEQAGLSGLDVDTRSDIYSLGVLLYELLVGRPPFSRRELEKVGLIEMLRMIREQEPARPSTKLSTSEQLVSLAACRRMEPRKLTTFMVRELDWVVMKALEKNRNRRYETASAFGQDVQRYLDNEPVLACPPSRGYRMRKFLRRNLGAVTAFLMIALALVLGIIGTSISLIRALEAEQLARDRLEQVEGTRAMAFVDRAKAVEQMAVEQMRQIPRALTFFRQWLFSTRLNDVWRKYRGKNDSFTLGMKELLGRASTAIEEELALQPDAEAIVREMLADAYLNLGDTQAALPQLERLLDLRRREKGSIGIDTASVAHKLGKLYLSLGQYDKAECFLQESLKIHQIRGGSIDPHEIHATLGHLYVVMRQYEKAETYLLKVEDIHNRLDALKDLAVVREHQGQRAEAETLLDRALLLAYSRAEQQDYMAALHPLRHHLREGEEVYRETLQWTQQRYGKESPQALEGQVFLARNLLCQRRFAEAEALLRDCLKPRGKPEPAHWPMIQLMLGVALLGQHRDTEAEPFLTTGYAEIRKRRADLPADSYLHRVENALLSMVKLYDARGMKKQADFWRKELTVITFVGPPRPESN